MRTLMCLLLLVTPPPLSPQGPADTLTSRRVVGPVGERVENLLRRYTTYGFSGSVLVALNGTIVLLDGYGLADREHQVENTPATLFEMNSITKTLTGVAVLQLAEQGRLRTSDSVSRYLGPFPTLKAPVTIEHLADHTAGLATSDAELVETSRDAFVQSVKDAPIDFRPGNRYRYNNVGFSMLAAVIERVSGENYDDYVRHHLFAAAGLTHSSFRREITSETPFVAHGYVGSPAGLHESQPAPYEWGTIGADGWVATVGDVYQWLIAVENRPLLSDESRAKLFAPRPRRHEAYGWHVDPTSWGTTVINKGGGSDQFASQLLYYPEERLVIVWASNNLRQQWRRTLNIAIPAAVLGREVPMPPQIARGRADIAPLTGGYDARNGAVYLRAGDGYLYARRNRSGFPDDVMFFPQTLTSFVAFDPVAVEMMTLRFTRSPTGATTAEFQRGKQTVNLQKRP